MQVIRAVTTCYLSVTFLDKDGVAAQPTSARWMAVDVASGFVMGTWAAFTPTLGVATITIPTTVNTIHDVNAPTEIRRIIVEGTYGIADKVTSYFDYVLENIYREV